VAAKLSQWQDPQPPKLLPLDLIGGGGGAEQESFGKLGTG
jgi:hypothetical protein